uniref:Copia protein n=1 Tax=Tanacetum cinerariifolium TaxID=118510 RepID=A0A6L2LP77_TANCI|nr:hypothetical protein [Tanacetum cinerariifolium]
MSTKIKLTKDDEADSVDSSKYRGSWDVVTYWFAKKQRALSISTTEVEYVSARRTCQQALWMKQALIDYGIRLDDVPIMCGNKGAIDLSLEPFLTLNEPICPSFFFPKHDHFKKNITTPRTTQTQPLRDSNKLHLDEIHPDLRGWELFFRENFFCSLGKRNKVNASTACMLYYITMKIKFNFTLMLIYRMEEAKNKQDGPMPFAMLLTRLFNHILQTNPLAIFPSASFTFHKHAMDPLDISRNPSKEKRTKIASPSATSSSSSSSDDNEAPSFLEFYDELSDNEDLTYAQREKRGMFKCLIRYVGIMTKYWEKQK